MVGRPVRLRTTRETSRCLRGLVTVNGLLLCQQRTRAEYLACTGAGGRSEQISRGGSGWFACESAHGKRLLYQPVTFRDGPIVAIPTTGGPAQPVLACVRTGAFLDTPQGLYYLACGPDRDLTIDAPVHLVERPTGKDRIIGTIEDYLHYPAVGGLAVAPDGREILYTRYMNRGSDLMLIENFR